MRGKIVVYIAYSGSFFFGGKEVVRDVRCMINPSREISIYYKLV